MLFVIVTTRAGDLAGFMDGLASSGAEVAVASSRAEALEAARDRSPELVVVDRDLPGTSSLALVTKLLMANAMINTAVISEMSEEEFHEESEGLGVLARVRLEPDRRDGEELAGKLRGLLGG